MPTPTQDQLAARLRDTGATPAPQTPPPASTLPTPSTPINVSTLGTAAPFSLPPAPVPSSFDISTLPDLSSLLNPPTTPAQQKQTDLETQLETDTSKLAGKSAAQIAAEDEAAKKLGATTGLADFTSQLRDTNAQITQLQADAEAASSQSEDRQAPTFAIRGEQAQIERQRSVKALGLSAIAQTLQGNIASAQDYATRAVELQFEPVQQEIDYLKQALDDNKDNLSREDAQRAEQLQVALQDRQTKLDQQKQDKTTILGWAAEAAKNGASSLAINQAMALSDPSQALQLLGPYLSDPVAKQQALADLAQTRANTTKTNVEASVAADPASKPATAVQLTYGNYAPRLQSADSTINSLTDTISKMPTLAFMIAQNVPSFLQPSNIQQFNQAKTNFINGVLRQESGAAISDAERKSYDQQYFPQPGDSQAVIEQKAQNRAQVIASYIKNAGSAYAAPVTTGDQYASLRSQLGTGEILISRSGQVGKIPQGEFNPKTDTKL